MDDSTIAAIATPPGINGIGIIKISGKNALPIAKSIFKRSGSMPIKSHDSYISEFKSHQLYHGYILEPSSGRTIDEVLLSIMKAPHSYTREDVVEINAHSGTVVIKAVLELVLKMGSRLAKPGEFTKRAYINGRIDLTQAEAVIDIINAKTEKSLKLAGTHIKGEMKKAVESIKTSLFNILAQTEANIDFFYDVETFDGIDFKSVQKEILHPLRTLIEQYYSGSIYREGLKVVIVGRPNVGKSSLMNCLIEKDRSIVTAIPGTTRDFIEESLNIRGVPVTIADTAGLHKTNDPIESIGIKKTTNKIKNSDLILFVVDVSCPLTADEKNIYDQIKAKNKRLTLVLNKADLVDEGFDYNLPESWNNVQHIKTSALYGKGIDELKDLIAQSSIGEFNINIENSITPNLRQKIALEKSLSATLAAVKGIKNKMPLELIAIDINEAVAALDEITGVSATEDVLDQIFSNFCIGK